MFKQNECELTVKTSLGEDRYVSMRSFGSRVRIGDCFVNTNTSQICEVICISRDSITVVYGTRFKRRLSRQETLKVLPYEESRENFASKGVICASLSRFNVNVEVFLHEHFLSTFIQVKIPLCFVLIL